MEFLEHAVLEIKYKDSGTGRDKNVVRNLGFILFSQLYILQIHCLFSHV